MHTPLRIAEKVVNTLAKTSIYFLHEEAKSFADVFSFFLSDRISAPRNCPASRHDCSGSLLTLMLLLPVLILMMMIMIRYKLIW